MNLFEIISANLFEIILALVLGFIAGQFLKSLYERGENDTSPILTVQSKIITKRKAIINKYYILFQIENNDRIEFKVPEKEYRLFIKDDIGELTFQGNRYKNFKRTI